VRRSRGRRAARTSGLTLVELVVAAGLAALLFVALFALLDDFLSLWRRSEERRALAEETSGVLELLASDLAGPEAGRRGDFLCEWVSFDTDGDGIKESIWPRLRLVRSASPAELQRLLGASPGPASAAAPGDEPVRPEGLLEVIWTVLPARAGSAGAGPTGTTESTAVDRDALAEGFLWRGERIFGPDRGPDVSFFSDRYLARSGAPRPGSVHEVSGGILWLGLRLATQTSLIHERWNLGAEPGDVAASWDAWSRGRPDPAAHYWNEPSPDVPPARGRPALPRRVRLELELEHAGDLKRRTRLAAALETKGSSLRVLDGRRLPEPGAHVLVDSEWMELLSVSGEVVSVRRGARGTNPAAHAAGALVHHGRSAVREVPIGTFREDWNL